MPILLANSPGGGKLANKTIGVAIPAADPAITVANIMKAEAAGVPAAWLTSGGSAGDSLTILAAAAAQTSSILLGTSIMQTWSRHPVTAARQAQTIYGIAPNRIRLGVGPSHRQGMIDTFGVDFKAPLGHLREYIRILKRLLQEGFVDFKGAHYTARASVPAPLDIPVMASALRPSSFELCGEESDGAISWVCPLEYLREQALPALKAGAAKAGRPVPPLIVHAPVCVSEDMEEVREGVNRQLGYFPNSPFYAAMFASAGFDNSQDTGWTDEMLDSVVISGDEETVAGKITDVFGWGASEVLATIITTGGDHNASWQRTSELLARVANS
jgi:F420-dependent oxidoreductase-like protein